MSEVTEAALCTAAGQIFDIILDSFQSAYPEQYEQVMRSHLEDQLTNKALGQASYRNTRITSDYDNLNVDDNINITIRVEDAVRVLEALKTAGHTEQHRHTIDLPNGRVALAVLYVPVCNPIANGVGYAIALELVDNDAGAVLGLHNDDVFSLVRKENNQWQRIYDSNTLKTTPVGRDKILNLVLRWESSYKRCRDNVAAKSTNSPNK